MDRRANFANSFKKQVMKPYSALAALAFACVAFAGERFRMTPSGLNFSDTFKDIAHVFVGALLGAAVFATCVCHWSKRPLWWMFALLTLAEVIAAIVGSFR